MGTTWSRRYSGNRIRFRHEVVGRFHAIDTGIAYGCHRLVERSPSFIAISEQYSAVMVTTACHHCCDIRNRSADFQRVEGVAHVRRRRGRSVQLGRHAGDGHVVYDSPLYPVLLPAEIFCRGYRDTGLKG